MSIASVSWVHCHPSTLGVLGQWDPSTTFKQTLLRDILSFVRSNRYKLMFCSSISGPRIKLPLLNTGGLNGSLLGMGLTKYDGQKKLLLVLSRNGDFSANTCSMYFIDINDSVDNAFANLVEKCLDNMFGKTADLLYEKSFTRRRFTSCGSDKYLEAIQSN